MTVKTSYGKFTCDSWGEEYFVLYNDYKSVVETMADTWDDTVRNIENQWDSEKKEIQCFLCENLVFLYNDNNLYYSEVESDGMNKLIKISELSDILELIDFEDAMSLDLALDGYFTAGEIECELYNAYSLEQLCSWLNSINNKHIDTSNLPIFGGEEPSDTWGIYSWDKDNILLCDNNFYIEAK